MWIIILVTLVITIPFWIINMINGDVPQYLLYTNTMIAANNFLIALLVNTKNKE